jgi:hypothetical protein
MMGATQAAADSALEAAVAATARVAAAAEM